MERRSSRRTMVQMVAEVEISVTRKPGGKDPGPGQESFRGVVETVDLSLCGMGARIMNSSLDTDRCFSPALAGLLVGKEICVSFSSSAISVWGKVVRFDPRHMLIAIVITRVSDIFKWRDLLSDAIFSEATMEKPS